MHCIGDNHYCEWWIITEHFLLLCLSFEIQCKTFLLRFVYYNMKPLGYAIISNDILTQLFCMVIKTSLIPYDVNRETGIYTQRVLCWIITAVEGYYAWCGGRFCLLWWITIGLVGSWRVIIIDAVGYCACCDGSFCAVDNHYCVGLLCFIWCVIILVLVVLFAYLVIEWTSLRTQQVDSLQKS